MSENTAKEIAPGVIEASPDDPKAVEVKKSQKPLSKQEQKKLRQYLERRQRLINQGVPPGKVDAVIAQQDYAALPLDKKFVRLEGIVSKFSKGILNDVQALEANDRMLAEVYDVNLRAMEKMFVKLGVSPNDLREAMKEAQLEIAAATAAQVAARETERINKLREREQELLNLAGSDDKTSPDEAAVSDVPEFGSTPPPAES